MFPSGEPGVSGDFWGSQEGCQGPSRPSGRNRGFHRCGQLRLSGITCPMSLYNQGRAETKLKPPHSSLHQGSGLLSCHCSRPHTGQCQEVEPRSPASCPPPARIPRAFMVVRTRNVCGLKDGNNSILQSLSHAKSSLCIWGLPRCVWARESTAPAQGNQSLSRESSPENGDCGLI